MQMQKRRKASGPLVRINLTVPQALLDRLHQVESDRFITVNQSLLFTDALEKWIKEQEDR